MNKNFRPNVLVNSKKKRVEHLLIHLNYVVKELENKFNMEINKVRESLKMKANQLKATKQKAEFEVKFSFLGF